MAKGQTNYSCNNDEKKNHTKYNDSIKPDSWLTVHLNTNAISIVDWDSGVEREKCCVAKRHGEAHRTPGFSIKWKGAFLNNIVWRCLIDGSIKTKFDTQCCILVVVSKEREKVQSMFVNLAIYILGLRIQKLIVLWTKTTGVFNPFIVVFLTFNQAKLDSLIRTGGVRIIRGFYSYHRLSAKVKHPSI